METIKWFARLIIWVGLVLKELPESGEVYVGEMLAPVVGGTALFVISVLVASIVPELGVWRWGVVGLGLLFYLLAGAAAYFWGPGSSYGPWYRRGAW